MDVSPTRTKLAAALFAAATTLFFSAGCTQQPPPATSNAPAAASSSTAAANVNSNRAAATADEAPATFINKVWRVRESSAVAPGTLYVFLSEGSLVVTSPNGKPALGTWKQEAGNTGAFTMTEEGVAYKTDVLGLTANEFKIRSNNPGRPVEITLIPAAGSFPAP